MSEYTKPGDLISYLRRRVGWSIKVGAKVVTTTPLSGDNVDGRTLNLKPGRPATVTAIRWYGGVQGVGVDLDVCKYHTEPPSEDLWDGITVSIDERDADEKGGFSKFFERVTEGAI